MLLQMLPRRPGFEANTGEALSTTSRSGWACCWMLLSLVPFTWYPDLQASRSACHLASSTCTINLHTVLVCAWADPIPSWVKDSTYDEPC